MTTAPEEHAYLLTYRQRQVLLLCANGFRPVEIARLLFLAYNTVKRHIQNALYTLQAETRAHAVYLALKLGELDVRAVYPNEPDYEPDYVPHRRAVYRKAA